MSYFHKKASLLEPDALLPILRNNFSYNIPSNKTMYLLASWGTRLGNSGRMEVRQPQTPMALRLVTLNGYVSGASAVLLDPELVSYEDPQTKYYDRLNLLDELPTQTIPLTAGQVKPFLTGAYGAIITRVVNCDLDWIIAGNNGAWYNLANEIGDYSPDYQRNDNALTLVCNKKTVSQVWASTVERVPGAGIGSVNYVLLPSTWGSIVDPTTYLFKDDFMLPSVDLALWDRVQSAVGNVEIDTTSQWLKLCGNNNWGTNGIKSKSFFTRDNTNSLIVDVFPGQTPQSTILIVGWNNGANVNYDSFCHSLVFNQSSSIQVYENGVNKGQVGTYSPGSIYRIKITPQVAGAKYEIQGHPYYNIGDSNWSLLTPPSGSNGNLQNLYFGATQWGMSSTTYLSYYRVI